MLGRIKKAAWLVPADCPGCGMRTPNQKLCHECTLTLNGNQQRPRCAICKQLLASGKCPSCHNKAIAFNRVITGFDYIGLGQQLVHDYKIHKRLSLAGLFADLMVESILHEKLIDLPNIIVPVPAHDSSIRERGFSPAAELARLIAKKLGVKYQLDLLWRKHETAKQSTLGYKQRQIAQSNAYACYSDKAYGKQIAVVDDVMTTGATLNTIANTLKLAGATSVQCWVLARTLR